MSAHPIIPGRLYLISYDGQYLPVIADHPCTAICIALAAYCL